jgi:hypothetical protein
MIRVAEHLLDSTAGASAGGDPVFSYGPLFQSFSTGVNSGPLSQLDLVLRTQAQSAGSLVVGLYADNSTSPGPLISTLATVNDSELGLSLGLFSVLLTANPVLSPGTRYWIGLVGDAADKAQWSWTTDTSGVGVAGQFYYTPTDGVTPNDPFEMRVAIPEPGTFVLLFAGGLLLGLKRFGTSGFRR